ncbi:Uncharacterised protein [Bordetella pertussis]|nr:Uncharacterised protein [Bordetella pertussis]CPP77514.1 Uncharacterised protein [Bordetella pertussis]
MLDLQAVQQLVGQVRAAYQHHVAAGAQGRLGAGQDVARHRRALHGQIVGEHHAIVAQPFTQDLADPAARKTRGLGIDLRIDHMRRHDSRHDQVAQPGVRRRVILQDARERPRIDRDLVVRIGAHEPMAGEMLAAGRHARQRQALRQRARQHGDHACVMVEGAIADHLAHAVVEVQYRREAEIDAAGAQLGGQHVAGLGRQPHRRQRIAVPQLAQFLHGRQRGKAIVAKALHAAALVVHRDQQRLLARLVDGPRQRAQLPAIGEIAREQDHPAHQGVAQAALLVLGQRRAGHIHHDGTGRQDGLGFLLAGHGSSLGWDGGRAGLTAGRRAPVCVRR